MLRLVLIALIFLHSLTVNAQSNIAVPVIITGPASFKVSDLSCTVDGKPTSITSLEPVRDRHLQYVLMNDRSGSGQKNWPSGVRQQAAIEDLFLGSVVQKGDDVGTLINFTDETFVDVINSNDPAALSEKIDRTGSGGSATYDAILRSTAWLRKQSLAPGSRKVIFIFTDGDVDNASHTSLRDLKEHLHKAGIPVFVFLPDTAAKKKKDAEMYEQIASESGGSIYYLPTGALPPTVFEPVKADLGNSFVLTITVPPDVRSGERDLSISSPQLKVTAPKKINVPKK